MCSKLQVKNTPPSLLSGETLFYENPNLSFPLPYILTHKKCGLNGVVGWSLKPT